MHKKIISDERNLKLIAKGQDKLLSETATTKRDDIGRPNREWQIDSSPFDFIAKHPEIKLVNGKFVTEMRNRRMNTIAIVDTYSGRRVMGLYDNASSYSVVRLLRKALLKFGRPESIRGDNGKDYISRHFQTILDELGIYYIASRPYYGRDKGKVERAFKSAFHSKLELLDGYIGHSVSQRQTQEAIAVKKSERLNIDKTFVNAKYTSAQWEMILDRVLEDDAVCRGWNEKWGDFQEQKVDSQKLNMILGKRIERKKVSREGIHWNRRYYVSDELFARGLINHYVTATEDIDNYSEIFVFDSDGNYLCKAKDRATESITVETARKREKLSRKAFDELIKTQKQLKKEHSMVVEEMFDIDGIRKEMQKSELEATAKKRVQEQTGIDSDELFEPTNRQESSLNMLKRLALQQEKEFNAG
jgi:transposase InsO family protein